MIVTNIANETPSKNSTTPVSSEYVDQKRDLLTTCLDQNAQVIEYQAQLIADRKIDVRDALYEHIPSSGGTDWEEPK